jgi:hypothetical protein
MMRVAVENLGGFFDPERRTGRTRSSAERKEGNGIFGNHQQLDNFRLPHRFGELAGVDCGLVGGQQCWVVSVN